jgi:multimeric flavodoxin WrbA
MRSEAAPARDRGAVVVLGLAGSPRPHGNSGRLLERFLSGAASAGAAVEWVAVAECRIAGCRACDECQRAGECVVTDDFQALEARIVRADVIALAAPLFFWNLPAQVKALVDRSQCQWARKCVLRRELPPSAGGHSRRRGVFLATGGQPEADFGGVLQTVRSFLAVYEADLWANGCYSGLDSAGEIEHHPTALEEAYRLGRRAVEEPW